MNSFDFLIFGWLNSLVFWKGWIDAVIVFKSIFLGWWILVILTVLIIFSKNKIGWLKASFYALLSGTVSRFVFTEIIRSFYNRPRPFDLPAEALAKAGVFLKQLIFHSSGYSFPSGHVAFFSAIAASIFFFNKLWGIIFLGIALYVGTGRVEAGIHWPSDIIGGALVGLFSAWIVKKISARFTGRKST